MAELGLAMEPCSARRCNWSMACQAMKLVVDTDEMRDVNPTRPADDQFDRSPGAVIKDMIGGGVSLPWNLGLAVLIGLSLLFTRVTLGAEGSMADAHHVIGALVLTVISVASAEVARPVRYLIIPLGAAVFVAPFVFDASALVTFVSTASGVALIALSFRRGPIRERYGNWSRVIV